MNRTILLIVLVMAIAGIGLIAYYANWQTAVGVFLMAYAHNIERHMR